VSEANIHDGRSCYLDDEASRPWFERQWSIWPVRADNELTTNISFHYGGVLAYRELHKREPALSDDFRSCVEWHDSHS